jgi:tetratricopeptide (TPR) repeat protein
VLEDDGLLELDNEWWHFRSDVVREVSYARLTKLVRAQRHAGIAAVMGDSALIPIDQVAHHAATAAELIEEIGPVEGVNRGMKANAVQLLVRATVRALDVGAFNHAILLATRALDLGPDSPEVGRELMLLRAEASVGRRESARARADAEDALEAALDAGDERHEGKARRFLGQIDQMSGDLPAARQQLGRSIEIFRQLRDDIELVASLRERGFAEVFGGSLEQADVWLEQAEDLSEKLNDRRGRAWVRQHQAWVAFLSGDNELAEKRLLLALHEFSELGDRSGSTWATGLLAFLRFFEFRFEEAEALAVAMRAESTELGERWGPAMMDSLLASIKLWTGNFVEAEELSRKSITEFRALDDRFGLVQALGPHNRALIALGRGQDAERGLEELLAIGDVFGDFAFPAMAAAGAAAHLGLGERAVVVGENAIERIAAMGADASEASVTYALGLCQTGRAEDALAILDGVDVAFPYAHAVRALAGAMSGDDVQPLADAEAVWAVEGSSYLDRVLADIAAAAVEVRTGAGDAAAQRLERAHSVAHDEGGAVARALVACTTSTLLGTVDGIEPFGDGDHLRPGWHSVISTLAGADPHP